MNVLARNRVLWPGLVLALLSAWIGGCASFTSHPLGRHTLEEIVREGKLPAITYDFSESGDQGVETSLSRVEWVHSNESPLLHERLEPLFRRAFRESRRQKEPGELHLDLYFRETLRRPALTYTLALLFIGSLGILPAYSDEQEYLEVKLKKNGTTVRQYVYTADIGTWFHWFMLPLAWSHDPGDVRAALVDELGLELLADLQRDLPAVAGAP